MCEIEDEAGVRRSRAQIALNEEHHKFRGLTFEEAAELVNYSEQKNLVSSSVAIICKE